MQALDVISVNIWSILISLANLAILCGLLKKFLYKPVKATMTAREESIAAQYRAADEAEQAAQADKAAYAEKLSGAQAEADSMLEQAALNASRRGERIVADAQDKAQGIIRQAQNEAQLEKQKAQASIRREITDVSAALTEKLLGREMSEEDHHAMIGSFLDEIGDD